MLPVNQVSVLIMEVPHTVEDHTLNDIDAEDVPDIEAPSDPSLCMRHEWLNASGINFYWFY